jgi:hypothetical protein
MNVRVIRISSVVLTLLVVVALVGPVSLTGQTVLAAPAAQSQNYLPLVGNMSCGGLKPAGPFGVQIYGSTGVRAPNFNSIMGSGAQWVRTTLSWRNIEPENTTPDKYNWAPADQVASGSIQGCLNVIATIDYAPDWAATYPNGPINPSELDDFVEFVGALVERYDGDGVQDARRSPVINYWEFYNEPDVGELPGDHRWGLVGDQYAAMLQAVYPVVKQANPNAKVVFGGIAYDWFTDGNPPGPFQRFFLDDVLKAGGGAFFDVMNFHTYPAFAANWTSDGGPGLFEKTAAVRAKLAEFGVEKPIVITEVGDHSNSDAPIPGSEETQLRHVTKLYTQVVAAGVEFGIWFVLTDLGRPYEYDSGLETNSTPPVRKPAFDVYLQTMKMLNGVQLDRVLSDAETGAADLDAYRFFDPLNARIIYVAWLNPNDTTSSKTLPLFAETATIIDVFGNETTIADTDDGVNDGKIQVTVTGRPIYIATAS